MVIGIGERGEVSARELTQKNLDRGRRRFLRTAAVGAAGYALGPPCWGQSTAKLAALNAPRNARFRVEGRSITAESIVARYNNFYEFCLEKEKVSELAAGFEARPWQIKVRGHVEKPLTLDVDDLLKRFALEERVYRHRCVEAWSIVVPWVGFPLAKFIEWVKPTPKARFLRMVSFYRPHQAPGQAEQTWYPWPYFEGLRLDEAMNELAFLVVGSYGHTLPNQNGAPIRLVVPWKYGYKSIKSITLFEFTDRQPSTFWSQVVPKEYDFLSNVNPAVPHPRWSQAQERDLSQGGKLIPTLPFNGYAEYVAGLYR